MQRTRPNNLQNAYNFFPTEDKTRVTIRDHFRRINPYINYFLFIPIDFNKTVTDDVLISWCHENCNGDYEYLYGSVTALDDDTMENVLSNVNINTVECLVLAFEENNDMAAFLLNHANDFAYKTFTDSKWEN